MRIKIHGKSKSINYFSIHNYSDFRKLDKENTNQVIVSSKKNSGIFPITAYREYFKEKDIHKITETFNKQLEIPNFSKLIRISDISNDLKNPNNVFQKN